MCVVRMQYKILYKLQFTMDMIMGLETEVSANGIHVLVTFGI